MSVVGPAVSIRGADATEYVHNPSGVTFKVAGTPGADNWRKVVRAVRCRPPAVPRATQTPARTPHRPTRAARYTPRARLTPLPSSTRAQKVKTLMEGVLQPDAIRPTLADGSLRLTATLDFDCCDELGLGSAVGRD